MDNVKSIFIKYESDSKKIDEKNEEEEDNISNKNNDNNNLDEYNNRIKNNNYNPNIFLPRVSNKKISFKNFETKNLLNNVKYNNKSIIALQYYFDFKYNTGRNILGKKFVLKNKKKCRIIINNKRNKLKEVIDVNEISKKKMKI